MSDHDADDGVVDPAEANPPEGEATATGERTTAPQSDYTDRDVGLGALIALAGLLVTFGLPLLLF